MLSYHIINMLVNKNKKAQNSNYILEIRVNSPLPPLPTVPRSPLPITHPGKNLYAQANNILHFQTAEVSI